MEFGRAFIDDWQTFAAAVGTDLQAVGKDRQRNRRALAIGAATALAVYAALCLNLDYPMWSGMTALTVTAATQRATVLKGLMRIAGTLAGALAAAFLLGFVADSNGLLATALFATVTYALYRSFTSPYPYAWLLGGITIGLVLMQSMAEPDIGLHVAAYRATEIIVGVVSAFAVGALLLPATSDPEQDRALAAAPQVERRVAMRTALEAGAGVCIVVGLYALFDLPGFASAAVSLTRIVDPNPELGRHRAFLRLIGCAIGGGAGLLMVGTSIDVLPLFLAVIFVFCSIFGYFFAGPPACAYAGMQAGFAFIIAYAPSITPTDTLDPAIDRFAGILLAFAVFWIIDMLFTPQHPVAATPPR
ncbi:FUSC family protein [Defluviicoccus vanus]|uniref:FUSC family protein n=1 Tax=Defluviicoccus vanus TaxID=111831 RepID=A0A7H1N4G7_9PROT|nr:FUSC family protein [Defluviicoccus vanus]QNT70603.1 FUSC family protein [Defluviicoccus vanus]